MSLTASLVIYDIPDHAQTPEGRPVPNPSPELRRVGVRVNLSCWIIPNHLIPYQLLNDLRVCGASWEVVKFDVSEAPKLVDMATRALRSEIRSAVARAREAERKAAAKVGDQAETDTADESYLRSCRSIIRRATKLVTDLQRSGEAFGIEAANLDILHAFSGLRGIQASAQMKAKTYADAVNKARSMGMAGDAMARACDADNSVTLILADWLEDHDVDVSALRAAFLDQMPNYGGYGG